MEGAEVTMATLIADLTTGASAIWEQVTTVSETIVGDPLLLFATCFLFVGGCIGIFGRVLARR